MFKKLVGVIAACLLLSGIALAGFNDDGVLSQQEVGNTQEILENAVASGVLIDVTDWFIDVDGFVVVFYKNAEDGGCDFAGVFEIVSMTAAGPRVEILGKMECGKAILDIMKVGTGEWRKTHTPALPEVKPELPKDAI